MNILLTGATGFVGQALLPALAEHAVYCLVRRNVSSSVLHGGIAVRSVDELDQHIDAVINLAGENIGAKRWSPTRKRALLDSRIEFTRVLGQQLAQHHHEPKIWINASAVGYYGDRPGEQLSEDSAGGSDFAAELCQQWEQAAVEAAPANARLVVFRLGVVMGDGGVLAKLRLPFRLGLGSVMGPGPQCMPWVGLGDVVRALHWSLENEAAQGVFNLVAPQLLSQEQFAKQLAAHFHRPCLMRMPAWALRWLMGEMSALLLVDQKVLSDRLETAGFGFQQAQFFDALQALDG